MRRGKRWLPDSETGERVLKELPVRFLPWWWRDDAGKLMLTLRYGSKRIELKPGQPDKLLMTAKYQRRRR